MQTWVAAHIEHVLALAIFLARAIDALTTWLATPNFKLEANPVVRRFRLPMIAASLALAFLPYFSLPAAIIVLVVSLLVSVSNSLRLWLVKAVGEEEYYQLLMRAAARADYRLSIFLNMLPGLVMWLLAFCLFLFYPDPQQDMGFYFAFGMALYGAMIVVNFPASFRRTRKHALRGGVV